MNENLKVRWLKPHHDFAYFQGDECSLAPEVVCGLVETGHVIMFPGETEQAENPLPENLPFRDLLFANGFETIEQVETAGDQITNIKGIGKKAFEAIREFLTSQAE
jgi:hypothetical protein